MPGSAESMAADAATPPGHPGGAYACAYRPRSVVVDAGGQVGRSGVGGLAAGLFGSRPTRGRLGLLRREDRLGGGEYLGAQFGPLVEFEQSLCILDRHDHGDGSVEALNDGSLAVYQGRVDVVAQAVSGRLDPDSHSLFSFAHVVSVQTDQTLRKACRSHCKGCKVCKATGSRGTTHPIRKAVNLMPDPIKVFSFGGGQQSVAALVLAAQGRIDYRTFLFANVGDDSERKGTLAYVEQAYGITYYDYLDKSADIPVISRIAAQGDVLIVRTDGVAPSIVPVPATGFPVVAPVGQGHTHALFGPVFYTPSATAGTDPSDLDLGTLTVPEGVQGLLSQPEHGGLLVEPGTYTVKRQREQADVARFVED